MARGSLTLHFCLLVFTCVLSFKGSGGLDCYCTADNCNENDTCTVEYGACYAKRCKNSTSGVISTQYSCFQAVPEVLNHICVLSAEDYVYQCCTEDFCNMNLVVLLPSEVSSPPPAATVAAETPVPTPTHVTQKPTNPPTTSATQSPSGDLKCYCNDTLDEPDSVCKMNDHSCNGGVCYAKAYRNDAGSIGIEYSCSVRSVATDFLCDGRLDNKDQAYNCCDSSDFCNRDLKVSLPLEPQSSVLSSPVETLVIQSPSIQEPQSSVLSSPVETLVIQSPSIQESQSSVLSSPVETSATLVIQSPSIQASQSSVLSSPASAALVTQSPTTRPDGEKENSSLFIWLSVATGGLMAVVLIIIAFLCVLTLLQIRARKLSLSKHVVNEKHRYPCNETTTV